MSVKNKKTKKSYRNKIDAFLKRRPHRSFRLTYRRDYKRSLDLPGYFVFTSYVAKILRKNRKLFISLALFFALLNMLMVGISSQDIYQNISETLDSTSNNAFDSIWGKFTKSGILLASVATGIYSEGISESQQIYGSLIFLLIWLTTIWLLRNILAGRKVKLRDGLYSSGSPIVSTFLIFLLIIVQLLPFALAMIGYGAANTSGLLSGGVEAMLFWIVALLLTTLSLYWLTSSLFALVIVTLPGMYPYQAIKTAGDLVIGRRMRIFFRLIWMLLVVIISWIIVAIPIIMLDSWLKTTWSGLGWMPIVPIMILIMTSFTTVWVSSYIYLLYRKVVDDESEPS